MSRIKTITFLFIIVLTASCSTLKNNHSNTEHSDKKRASYSAKLGVELPKGYDEALIKEVIEWLGTPYLHGGEEKSGADCSGFVMQVYKTVYGISTARSANGIYEQSIKVNRSNLKQGELVFFKINTANVGHVGILLLDPFFIHASSSKGVMVSSLHLDYWNKYFVSGGRITKSI